MTTSYVEPVEELAEGTVTLESEDRLPELFLQCENCHCLMWLDPYTGLCVGCREHGVVQDESQRVSNRI